MASVKCGKCGNPKERCTCAPTAPSAAAALVAAATAAAAAPTAAPAAAAPTAAPAAAGGDSKKRKGTAPADPSAAPAAATDTDANGPAAKHRKPLNIGESLNTIKSPQARTRTGFWNVQNFTSDLVKIGKAKVSQPKSSPRNRVRMELIADVVVGLGFESLVILEMGSDAEGFLGDLVTLLNQRMPDKEKDWGSDISVDNGAVAAPPSGAFEVDLTSWGSWSQRVWALCACAPYFTIGVPAIPALTPRAHLEAHLRLAQSRRTFLPSTSILSYGDDDLDLTHALIGQALDRDKAAAHRALFQLCTATKTVAEVGAEPLAIAHYLVSARPLITFRPKPDPIASDGPLHALRILGVLAGRYEKYGIVRRQHGEVFLLHQLVDTPLQVMGRPTNSRAAWNVNLPLGGAYVPAYFIHSMWTPADADEDDALANTSAENLRVATLVAQAEAASKAKFPPVLIAGDTNVNGKHVGALNKAMTAHGYTRQGKLTATSLRAEKTMRTAPAGDVAGLLSEPYDAVYLADAQRDNFDCNVAYPDWTDDVLTAAFLQQLVTNEDVQQWYVELLLEAYAPIVHRADGKTRAKVEGRDQVAGVLKGRNPKTIADYVAIMDALRKAKLAAGKAKGDLLTYVATFLELDARHPRTFLLFHRAFISDHRIVLIDLATTGYLGQAYVPKKGTSSSVDLGSSKAAAAPAGPPVVDDGDGQNTPGVGARVACLRQDRNTCGVRAAYNCLWLAGARNGTHAQLWAFAAAALAPAPPAAFNVNHAVDISEDQVEAVLNHAGQLANVPVVGQFLYYDAMVNGILPSNPGATRITAYRALVAAFRAAVVAAAAAAAAAPPPAAPGAAAIAAVAAAPVAPVLRIVLHTDAQAQVHRQAGVGHFIAVEITAQAPAGYAFRYADSLSGVVDRTALVQAFIARYLP